MFEFKEKKDIIQLLLLLLISSIKTSYYNHIFSIENFIYCKII